MNKFLITTTLISVLSSCISGPVTDGDLSFDNQNGEGKLGSGNNGGNQNGEDYGNGPSKQNTKARNTAFLTWVEGDGTEGSSRKYWDPYAEIEWDNLLGDFIDKNLTQQGLTPFTKFDVNEQDTWIEFDVSDIVNRWMSKEYLNHGFRISTTSTGIRISSKEGSYPPELIIDGNPVNLLADGSLRRSTYQALGSSEELSISGSSSTENNIALIRFDLKNLNQLITNATLRLYVTKKYSGSHQININLTTIDLKEIPEKLDHTPLTSSYSNEDDLCKDSAVIFCDQLNGSLSSIWEGSEDDVSFVQGIDGMAGRMTVKQGSNSGGSLKYRFTEDAEEVFLRFYIKHPGKFDTDLDGGKQMGIFATYSGRSVPPGIPGCESKAGETAAGGWGGRRTLGCNGWSSRGHWSMSGTQIIRQGYYVYHMDQETQYGQTFDAPSDSANKWHCMEVQIKMNSRFPNTLKKDGIFRLWKDNNLYAQKLMRYTRLPFGIEGIWWNIYHGGKAKAPYDINFDIDNVVLSKKRIGCF